jgi:hypothetical protein
MRRIDTKTLTRIISIVLSIIVICYVVIANSVPFNISRHYGTNTNNTLVLTPPSRVKKEDGKTIQKDNLVYFNSPMPFKFDNAKAKVLFKNPTSQPITLGYKDQPEWHYNTQVLDDPLINTLSWPKVGNGPYLYQKVPKYNSVKDFVENPPQNNIVGVTNYTNLKILQPDTSLPDYSPSSTGTTIDVPLRGRITMYAYLKNEPFKISFNKRDLNWYADPDTTKISVYKGKEVVFTATLDDDGNTSNNQKAGAIQTVTIKNPGPGLPEAGVYKITIDSPGDSLITSISTSLHKLAFQGPLYVADNHEIYGGIVKKTQPTVLTTGAQGLNFRSDHGQSGTITVGQQSINMTKLGLVYSATNTSSTTSINIPGSDTIINGSGYFAFSPEQYFAPTPYRILPINSINDIALADYIITDYPGAPKRQGEWLVAERNYNIRDAVIIKGQLGWLISIPGLKDNQHKVEYKQIEMTLSKRGWLKD